MASVVFGGAAPGNRAAVAANPRPDLVFSGGRVASQAHVFADPASIASQLADLKETLLRDDMRVPTPAFVACVAFHAMHLHPFQDGNGRWARQLVVEAATGRGAPLSGVAHAALLNEGKPHLVSRHWPAARECGLRDYVERCSAFDADMRSAAASNAMVLSSLYAHLGRVVRPAWLGRDLLVQLCLGESLSIGTLRATCNVSRHVAEGWCKALSDLELPGLAVLDDVISLTPLIDSAERSARLAVAKHFGALHT